MGNVLKYINVLGTLFLKPKIRNVSYFAGAIPDLDQVKSEIRKFEGGRVELDFDEENCIAIINLDYPEKRNALSGKMMAELADAVTELEKWENGKGLLISGKKVGFCSGGDLDFVRKVASPESGFKMSSFMTHWLTRIQKLPIISLAYIDGTGALGGGAEICVACDFRLITSQSRIGFVHSRMGIIPAWGGNLRLTEVVGKTKALEMVVTGEVLKPEEALKCGLVNGIVTDKNEALAWLKKRVSFDSNVVRAAKAAVIARDLETENRIFSPLFGGSQNRKALEENVKHRN